MLEQSEMASKGHGDDQFSLEPNEARLELSLSMQFRAMLRAWRLIAIIVGGCIVLGLLYIAISKPLYEATAIIGPSTSNIQPNQDLLSQYKDLAELTSSDTGNFDRFLQVIHSARLAQVLDKKYGAMGLAFAGRDEATKKWNRPSGFISLVLGSIKALLGIPAWQPPTAARFADWLEKEEYLESVADMSVLGPRNRIKTISLTLDSREDAEKLLMEILIEADDLCRQDTIVDLRRQISRLNQEIAKTNEVYVRENLDQLLVKQQQNMIVAQSKRYYSFDLIDLPNSDLRPVWPHGGLVILAATFFGIVISFFTLYLILLHRIRNAQPGEDPLQKQFPNPARAAIDFITRMYRKLGRGKRVNLSPSGEG